MVGKLLMHFVVAIIVLCSLFHTSSAQKCKGQTLTKKFASCRDLPQLSSYLHWTYDKSKGKLDMAFRHAEITSTGKWVAWAINKDNNLDHAMVGAQAFVAILPSKGAPKAYTSPITNYMTKLTEGKISYPVSNLTATYQNNEVTIYATLTLPKGTTSLVHLW